MEKLELKHLAPYLPYGLKITIQDLMTYTVSGLTKETIYTEEGKVFNYKMCDLPQVIFPILRPLSDLTKEIEVNGEKFVPIERIKKKMLIDFTYDNSHSVISIKSPTGNTLIGIGNEIVDECPIGFYNQLIKLHFDTQGLIKTGLAIDFNTLK